MRKGTGRRTIAFLLALLIVITCPGEAVNAYGMISYKDASAERVGLDVTEADKQDESVSADAKKTENTDVEDESDRTGSEEKASDTETAGTKTTEVTEATENTETTGSTEATETIEATETEESEDSADHPAYQAEDLRFLVQSKEDFGDFSLTDGITYDEEHYTLSVIDDDDFDCEYVGDYVIRYRLTAKEAGYEDIEFTRTITIYADEQYMHDGVLIYGHTGDMEMELAEDAEDGIAAYAVSTVNVVGTGVFMDYFKCKSWDWATGTEVMYAENVNGYNRLVYCLESNRATPGGSNVNSGAFSDTLQKQLNYVLYHGARYYGYRCFTEKYQGYNANEDYYITSMAVHMLNAWAGNEPGYIFTNAMVERMSADGQRLYWKVFALVNDAMSDGSTYWNEAMWSNNTVTLKPETTSTWTYNSTTGRYESESFCPYFKDIYGYTGRNVISCVDQNGKRVGTVRFLGSGMFESFRISLTEAEYTQLQKTGGTLKATVQFRGYVQKATRYIYNGKKWKQPTAMIQLDGSERTRNLAVTATVKQNLANVYVQKVEENTNISLSDGFEFDIYEWNKNSKAYTKLGSLTWKKPYYTNDSLKLPITVINQGKFKVVETKADASHKVGWSKEFVATSNNLNIYLTATNEPNPSKVKIIKTGSDTGKALAGAEFTLYKDKDCTDPVKVDGKAVTVTSGTDGVAETAQFVRTQTSYWVKETKAPDGYKLAEEPKQVVVPAGGTGTVRFEDERSQYRVKVVKTCTQDKSYLEGAVYGVYSERSCSSLSLLTKVGPTGTGGVAVSDPIDYDPNVTTIYLKELVAPKYHKLSSTVYTLKVSSAIDNGGVVTLTATDEVQTTTALIHKVGEDGKGLAGAEFALYKDENCTEEVVKIGPTNGSGNAESKTFHPTQDTYYLKETRQPTNYPAQPDKVYKVSVQDGKATAGIEYTVTNTNKIQIVAYKYEVGSGTKMPLRGAEFTIYSDAACKNRIATMEPTNSLGYVKSGTFAYTGPYCYVKETKAPTGYKLSSEVKKVDVSNVVKDGTIPSVAFYDEPYDVTVEVLKVDADDGTTPLEGATFAICTSDTANNGNKVAEGTTGKDGKLTLSFHPTQESYWLIETKHPDGYTGTKEKKQINISDTREGTVVKKFKVTNKKRINSFPLEVNKSIEDVKDPLILPEIQFEVCVRDKATGEIRVLKEFWTDKDGHAYVDDIEYIDDVNTEYYLKEIGYKFDENSPSPPWIPNSNKDYCKQWIGRTFSFTPNGIRRVELNISNEKLTTLDSKIRIRKVDNNGNPLKGAIFRIYTDRDCKDLVRETNPTGDDGYTEVTMDYGNNWNRRYFVKEFKYPDGGPWQELTDPKEVFLTSAGNGAVTDVEFVNTPEKPSLTIYKYDSETGKPLQGAEFNIKFFGIDNTAAKAVWKTNEDGIIEIPQGDYLFTYGGLTIGKVFTITEITAPNGYKSASPVTTTLKAGENRIEIADDPKTYDLQITKEDKTGKKIAGAVFGIYPTEDCKEEDRLALATTDASGIAKVNIPNSDLSKVYRSVWIREEYVPDGYVLDREPRYRQLALERINTISFVNEPVTGIPIEIYKYAIKTDATQTALSGIHFYLNRTNTTTITEESIDLGTTNSNGYIHKQLENVEPGDYYLVETDAPSIYTNPVNPRKITLKAGNSNHFEVANVYSTSKWHSLKIKKVDANTKDPLAGVVFEVYADAKCTKLIETLSATDENGYAYSSVYGDDTLSHVWVKERSDTVPYGYKVKNTPLEVSVSSDSSGYIERTIENTPMKKKLMIEKKDSYTKTALAGAKFALYTDEACTEESMLGVPLSTDADGTVSFTDIPVAYEKVYLKEIQAPDGYDLDETPREVTLTNDVITQTITWENSRKWTAVKIHKVDTGMSGINKVEFAVFEDYECTKTVEGVGPLVTDSEGYAVSIAFPYKQDTYYLKELKAPYYERNVGRVFPVKVQPLDDPTDTSGVPVITIINSFNPTEIKVTKQDKVTGKPIQGAVFEIYSDKDEKYPQGIIGPTDENGVATAKISFSMYGPQYYLKEVYVPAPYKLSDDLIPVTDGRVEVTVYNESEPSKISLTKTDKATGEKLAGAVFGAYLSEQDAKNGENKQFEIGPTSASGFAVSKEFTAKASTYYLKEITAPKGYTLSSEIRAVDIVGGEIVDAGTFEDQKEENSAFIEVTKVSADDANKKLAGAVFAIYDNEACSGEPVQIMDPTDENGYSKSKELLVTKDTEFYLKEITTPTGYYQLKDSVKVTAKMKDTTQVTIENTPIPTTTETAEIKIKKTVTDTTDPLAGAVFGIYTDGQCQNLWMELPATDDNGEAVSPTFELVPGTAYYVKEIYAPAGYELSNEVTTVNVVAGQKEYVVERTNTPKWTQIQVKKYDAESKTLLKGAKFTVYADVDCTTALDTFTTGSDGIGTSKQLLMDQDVFYVKETEAPSGYTATNAVWKVTAKENDVCAMLEVPNVKDSTTNKFVYVKVKKVESGTNKALQGAYFTVYKDADCTKPVVEVGPTDVNGEAVSVQFIKEQDTYWIKESKAPDGYVLSDQVQQITPGTDTAKLQAVTFENSRRQIKIRVNKTDAETDEPLAGAYFKVYKSKEDADKQQNEVCEIGPTDKNGQAEATIDYEQNTYYLRESRELTGYVKSDSVDTLVITGDTTDYYATNTPEYTMIGIKKIDADTGDGLAGAEFNIYSDSECTQESFVGVIGPTDDRGYAYSDQIRAGSKEFYLKETKAPDGYPMPYDDDVYGPVDGNAVGNTKDQISAPFEIENQKIEISFDIEKRDIKTKKLLAGAAFALYKDAECREKVLDFQSTKADGVFTSGTFEATQEVYYIKEETVPQGYQEPDGPTEVNIYKLLGMEESDRKVTIMNVPENTKTIKVAVNKIDAVTAEPVEGAVFAVYEDEKCTKEITRLPKTDQGGYAQSEEFVYTGSQDTYYLKEVGAPKWYHANNTVIPFKVETKTISGKDENGNSTSVNILYVEPQTIKNEPEMTQIQVKKTDAESGDTLAGAYFKVYKTMADAQKQQNEVCEIGPTGADGIAVSKKFHRMQDEVYYIRESKAPEGYVISDEIKEVTTEAEQISNPVLFTDEKAKTKIQIRKTAANGITPLQGAVFELYETAECTGKPLLTLPATGTNGIATSDSFQITQEWYYLKEKTAPAGYEVSTTVIPVKPENGATLTVGPILNGKADDMAEIHILKKEAGSDKVLAGAVYGIYPSKDCIAGTEIGMIGPTDAGGKADSGKFVKKQSSYYLKELQAPEGYECSDTVTEVNLDNGEGRAGNPVTLYDTQKKSKIQIYKYQTTTGSPLRGITFTVYTDEECTKPFTDVSTAANGTLTTGDDGYAVSKEFVPTQEIYYIKETAVPQDYSFTLPDTVWEISVTAGETAEIQIANGALAKIYVRKTAKDDPNTTLSGAEFDIYKDFECTMKVGSVGPTDKLGEAVSTSFTKEQDIYYLKETKAPDGYKLRQEPIAVTVTNPDDDSSKINWNVVEDEKLEGSITVKKLDRNEKPLQGAGFQLEVFNGGSWSTAVGNKETDADGIVKFEHLEPGRYRLTEIKAPQGFNLLNSSREITIPYEMNVADVTETPTGYTETKGDKIYFYDITLTFYNSLPFNVPVTGGSGNFGAATIGILLMAGTAACALLAEKRRKKKRRAS